MTPDVFWNSTFDEVLLVIKGKVDDWRIARRNTYNLYCTWCEKPISIYDFAPLAFDDDLKAKEKKPEESLQEWYEHQSALMAQYKWN